MQLTQSASMRMEQRQLLTPRMIQSMEILQLPLMALEERIEQELQNNPVLEIREHENDGETVRSDAEPEESKQNYSDEEQTLVVKDDNDGSADFERLAKISEFLENEEFVTNGSFRDRTAGGGGSFDGDGERDRKMDAMANTASRGENLTEHLLNQWMFIEHPTLEVRRAGEALINYIDGEGYLRTPLETIQQDSKKIPVTLEDLNTALLMIQKLEPAGIGARDLGECLLLQLDALEEDEEAAEGHDFDVERALVRDHLKDLEMNRYPLISRKLGRPIEDIKDGVKRLSRLHAHPGKQIAVDDAPPITPDAIIYFDEDTGRYEIEMTHDPVENLTISGMWRKYIKEKKGDKKTREFLSNNVRNARWLIESIEQRKSTIQRVIRVVVDAQVEFFEKGPEHLKPLPMINVADQLGIHVATVSRAVSEKWIQTPRGVYPLRRFFSGGTTNSDGEDMSWDAVKEKLKIIIADEDKQNPLNDDEIVEKLAAQGLTLARRTVAKYRKIMNIPTARQRKEF